MRATGLRGGWTSPGPTCQGAAGAPGLYLDLEQAALQPLYSGVSHSVCAGASLLLQELTDLVGEVCAVSARVLQSPSPQEADKTCVDAVTEVPFPLMDL